MSSTIGTESQSLISPLNLRQSEIAQSGVFESKAKEALCPASANT